MYAQTMDYFNQLTQIPRESKKEEKVRKWLCERAHSNGFDDYKIDKAGNLVINVPATPGYENKPALILQSHMDMVCEKTPESKHNFDIDPIQTIIADGWMYSKDTTLGADNGIGLVMSLAAKDVPHPRLELLFTVDEETGLHGAADLDPKILSGKTELFLNLDTEDEGEVCIGSAGSAYMYSEKEYATKPATLPQFSLDLKGASGGHSGMEIHLGKANANQLLAELLYNYKGKRELASIKGGNKLNAIPRDCSAVIGLEDPQDFVEYAKTYINQIKNPNIDPNLEIAMEKQNESQTVMSEDPKTALEIIKNTPVGVYEMDANIEGLVQTSLNLGTINIAEGQFKLGYMPRGAKSESFDKHIEDIQARYEAAGFDVKVKDKIYGWVQNPNDAFVNLITDQYGKVISSTPEKKACHAGLECGAISGKFTPNLQAVSVGPNIKGVHAPGERVQLASVEKVALLVENTLYQLING